MEVALPRWEGGVVGEAHREREGRRLSPAPGAAITGACHLSLAVAARARNGREAEIPGGYGRAGRLRLGEKKIARIGGIVSEHQVLSVCFVCFGPPLYRGPDMWGRL